MVGTASGGDFGVNIGECQTVRAIDRGGLPLQHGLILERPNAAQWRVCVGNLPTLPQCAGARLRGRGLWT